MRLGLFIENRVITAAIVADGGDFVLQNRRPIVEDTVPYLYDQLRHRYRYGKPQAC